jgi:hypothetical protein
VGRCWHATCFVPYESPIQGRKPAMLRNSWMPIAVVLAANAAGVQHCYGTVHSLGLNMSQTLWSFQAFSQLKEANFQVAAAEATFRSAQQNLLLRVAQADIPLVSPDPESADDWVMSARQDNFDMRSAQLKMEAASRDVSVQRGRGPAGKGSADIFADRRQLQTDPGRSVGRQSDSGHGGDLLQLAPVPRRRGGIGGTPIGQAGA